MAKEIVTDVSKFLKFAQGPTSTEPDFGRLLDREQLVAFVDKLAKHIGPEGRITKLDSLDSALSFIRLKALKNNPDDRRMQQAALISESIKAWKSTLRKEKLKRRVERMEKLSATPMTFDDANELLESEELWQHYLDCVEKVEEGEELSRESLKDCAAIIAAMLLFKSWQRPGAVINATLPEYHASKVVQGITVIRVKEHKTGVTGSAKLMLTGTDSSRLKAYVCLIRPQCDPNGLSEKLLVFPGAKCIKNLNYKLQTLGRKYGLNVPTATKMRKIGATSVALNVTGPKSTLVTRQLSHSIETDARFYQALESDQHAVAAFTTMETLRRGQAVQPEPQTDEGSPCSSKSIPTVGSSTNAGVVKRRPFTEAESDAIHEYFSGDIAAIHTPSLHDCKTFLTAHPSINRNAKQVQDKVKNIIKK